MTRQYGRGTDFVCYDKRVTDRERGVHVIAAFLPESAVEETQIRGRTGRLDNPGSFEKILWAQDLLNNKLITKEQLNALAKAPDSITDDALNAQRDILLAKQLEAIQAELKSTHATHERTCQLMEAIKNGEKQKAFDLLTGVDLSEGEDDN
jgi:preprotein translocase subunit SecA